MNSIVLAAMLTAQLSSPPAGWYITHVSNVPRLGGYMEHYARTSRIVPMVHVGYERSDLHDNAFSVRPPQFNLSRPIFKPLLSYDDPSIPGDESRYFGSHWVPVPGRPGWARQYSTGWPVPVN